MVDPRLLEEELRYRLGRGETQEAREALAQVLGEATLQAVGKDTVAAAVKVATNAQLTVIREMLRGNDATYLDYQIDHLVFVPQHIQDRADDGELFMPQVKRMMYACGDVAEPHDTAAVACMDILGQRLRKGISMLPPGRVTLAGLAQVFPRSFPSFQQWFLSKHGAQEDPMEDEPLDSFIETTLSPSDPIQQKAQSPMMVYGKELGTRQRLTQQNQRTDSMSVKEYLEFSDCRSMSLLKEHKTSFLRWVGIKPSYIPRLNQTCLLFLTYVTWDTVALLVESTFAVRSHFCQLYRLSEIYQPLRYDEILLADAALEL